MLQRERVQDYMPTGDDPVRADMDIAIRSAYAGGSAEMFQFGNYEGPVYQYDLNSAYPYAAEFLPCLQHGRWHATEFVAHRYRFQLLNLRWSDYTHTKPIQPRFYREHDGGIIFPSEGQGWY